MPSPPLRPATAIPSSEIGLIAGSVALLVIIAIPTVRDIWYTHDVPEEEKKDAMEVLATRYQWGSSSITPTRW